MSDKDDDSSLNKSDDDMTNYLDDFEDDDDFNADDGGANDTRDSGTEDKGLGKMLEADDAMNVEFEKSLAMLPTRSEDEGVSKVAVPPTPQAAGSHASPRATPEEKHKEETATVVSKTTIKAWESAENADGLGGSAQDVVVLEIDGRLELVHSDDIRAQDMIGLAPEAEEKEAEQLQREQEKNAQQELEQKENKRREKQSTSQTRLSNQSSIQSTGGTSSTKRPAKPGSKEAWAAPGQSTKPSTSTAAASKKALTAQSQLYSTQSMPSFGTSRSTSKGASHLKSMQSSTDDGAFNAWLSRKKKKDRAKSASRQPSTLSKAEIEKQKRESGEAAFAGWLEQKKERQRKELQMKKRLEAKQKEEEKERESRRKMSEGLYEGWCSEKSKQKRLEAELAQLAKEHEEARIKTITEEENHEAYQRWIQRKETEALKTQELMALKRQKQVEEARRIKRSLELRYHPRY
eukprot:scpid63236/ scgid35752/ 